jgi:uncharacterized membrane protein YciS (DUF1049 family)
MICTLSGATLLATFVLAVVFGIGFVIGSAIASLFVKPKAT